MPEIYADSCKQISKKSAQRLAIGVPVLPLQLLIDKSGIPLAICDSNSGKIRLGLWFDAARQKRALLTIRSGEPS